MQQTYNPDERKTIQLFLAARELTNLKFFSKSSPFLELFYTVEGEQEISIGKTESQNCNLEPSWEKSFSIEYYPDLRQVLRFQIFDEDGNKREYMGETQITLKEIVESSNLFLQLTLQRFDKICGKLLCKGVLLNIPNNYVSWKFQGINIKKSEKFFETHEPFLRFYLFSDNIWCLIHSTEGIQNEINPVWEEFEISLELLCQNDEKRKFKVECIDKHNKEKHNRLIGSFETTIDEIFNQNKESFTLLESKGKNAGIIQLMKKQKILRPNFNDLIRHGTTFNIVIGIDYSSHNSDPQFPDSLHSHLDSNNLYSKALKDIADILENYNQQNLIALYGICAEPHLQNYSQNSCQNIFPLTGDFANPQVVGSNQVLQCYQSTLKNIIFNGDFLLNDFVQYLQQIAQHNEQKQVYTIGVILTQGKISDHKEVMKLLNQKLPLSVFFLGIGDQKDEDITKLLNEKYSVSYCSFQNQPKQLLRKNLFKNLHKYVVSYYT